MDKVFQSKCALLIFLCVNWTTATNWPWSSNESENCGILYFTSSEKNCNKSLELQTGSNQTLLSLSSSDCKLSGEYWLRLNENCSIHVNRKYFWEDGMYPIISNDSNSVAVNISLCECNNSPNEFIGVIYSPYDKHPINNEQVSWWDYTKSDISAQLQLISTQFRDISTYGVGTVEIDGNLKNVSKSWKDSLPIAQTPLIIAELNKAAGYHKLRAIVGAFLIPSYPKLHRAAEVSVALSTTMEANAIFPGSIFGISIHFELSSMQDEVYLSETLESLEKIPKSKEVMKGLRFTQCEKAFEKKLKRVEDSEKLYCKPTDLYCTVKDPLKLMPKLEMLVKSAEFIICFITPSVPQINSTMGEIVGRMGHDLVKMRAALRAVSPSIQLILETGWPSKGYSRNESPNTLRNMRDYWVEVSKWGIAKQFKVFMFEAFNEPWKMKRWRTPESLEVDSVCGSEGFYGWWMRISDSNEYITKVSGLQPLSTTDGNANTTPPVEKSNLVIQQCVSNGTDPIARTESPQPTLSTLVVLIVSICIIAIMILGLVLMGFRLKTAKNSETFLTQRYLEIFRKGLIESDCSEFDEKEDYQMIALRFPYNKRKYELAKGIFKIDLSKRIGKGQGGTVYLGSVEGIAEQVAFKTTDTSSSILDIKNLLSEIKILSYIDHHDHVICLIGAYTEKLEKGIVYLALEYCPLGSLDKFLQNKGKFVNSEKIPETLQVENLLYVTTAQFDAPTYVEVAVDPGKRKEGVDFSELNCNGEKVEYDYKTMLKWSYETASGMEYLASKKVVHADLACRNLLLTLDKSIKITDFGLSQKLYTEIKPNLVFDTDVALPWRYMAPESLRNLSFSVATDVWSFGITVFEIFSEGAIPFAGYKFSNEFVLNLEEGLRVGDPQNATEEILDILDMCCSLQPNERPDFTRLKEEFGALLGHS